jgi:hypothetical protein
MRRLPLLAAAVAVLVTVPAHAAVPVVDGKTKKTYAFSADVADPQVHLLAETVANPVDVEPTTECVKPRCYAFPFTVKHARGVPSNTPLSVKVSWGLRTSRFWLYLMDVSKRTPGVRQMCATFYVTNGTSAVVRVPSVKQGGKYEVWVTVQQLVAPDKVTGTVSFPAKDAPGPNPAQSPSELFVNGCNA